MPDCKACGQWFASTRPDELCSTCERALERLCKYVAPVVHGRWKCYKKRGIAVCTHCSFERKLDDDFGRAISCPNCGARMDLEG